VECDAGDVGCVAVESENSVRIRRLDIVQLDGMVARGGEVALVGGDAEAIDL
jgi:hypothetical protein